MLSIAFLILHSNRQAVCWNVILCCIPLMVLYNILVFDLGIVSIGCERVIQGMFISKIAFSLEWVDCLNVLTWCHLHCSQGYIILEANVYFKYHFSY